MKPQYRKHFAFSIANGRIRGHYEFNCIVQGSNVSAALFQQGQDEMWSPIENLNVGAYIDDIYIFSKTFEEHKSTLQKVFDILMENNLTANIKKCQFF